MATINLTLWQRIMMVFKPKGLRVSIEFTFDSDIVKVQQITGEWVSK